MNNLFVVPIEPIETRYTKHWYEYLPGQLERNLSKDINVHIIQADISKSPENSPGAFFNFEYTSQYKSAQVIEIGELFKRNMVRDGDVFFYTDYWNPSVGMLRYMASLANKRIKIVGIGHAGLWDSEDMLTKSFGKQPWGRKTEEYLFSCYDELYFATDFSKHLYLTYIGYSREAVEKCHTTGFPMEYYSKVFTPYWELPAKPFKEDLVVFPHRKAAEKNIDLFYELEKILPEYKFVVALDVCKNKNEYHNLLYRAKVCFSAATQETLGISMGIEALRGGCFPLVPDRLSYAEIFRSSPFLYDTENTMSIACEIRRAMTFFDSYQSEIEYQHDKNLINYFTGNRMYQRIGKLYDTNQRKY